MTKKKKIIETTPFLIVGIGASAGGLEAFTELFHDLPSNTGMAFVLIQHLSPEHFSMLSDFIRKATKMQVQEVQEGMRVEQDNIYVIPPNATLEIFHGVLHLSPMAEPRSATMAVNAFLRSLAHDQGNLSIGIVLSGTGSDGSLGLREIKAEGGITFVQDPATAKFDGMPLAAITTESPDHVMPIKAIAQEIIKIASHPIFKSSKRIEEELTPEVDSYLQKIFILIRNVTKIDFSSYKFPTINRRIKRRMVLHKIESLKDYLTYLQMTPKEVQLLFEDLLINVTHFFRDIEAFEALKKIVFPEIIVDRVQDTPIRIWVPGCSTGEEVYSLAIVLLEYLGENACKFPIQIYGTDISESTIKVARSGLYARDCLKTVSDERLERFFVEEKGGFRISRIVRNCCIFSIQDVTSQPPINRLDLLSCRNLMIYLGPSVQKKLMETFFYALNPNGYLFLGSSESVAKATNLFSIVDKKNKIYIKRNSFINKPMKPQEQLLVTNKQTSLIRAADLVPKRAVKLPNPVLEAEHIVLDRYAPAWILINQAMEIVQLRGRTEDYVVPASGQPSWNLLSMLREGLLPDLMILIHLALKKNEATKKNSLTVKNQELIRHVNVEVIPIIHEGMESYCLILFLEDLETQSKKNPKKLKEKPSTIKDREVTFLKEELSFMQQSFRSIIEDQNATNEALQSSNEEVLSANEELQSTNEELETAKEELQSINEELTTLNEELGNRNNELSLLNNDLSNILSNANVPIIILDSELRIRRFTPHAEKLFNFMPTDAGRSIADLQLGLQIDNLPKKISEVIRTAVNVELETHDRNERWCSVRIRPYKTMDNKIDGAVVVVIDIHDIKLKEQEAQMAKRFSDGIIQIVQEPIILLNEKLWVEKANNAFFDLFKISEKDVIRKSIYEIDIPMWDRLKLKKLLEEILVLKKEVFGFEISSHAQNEEEQAVQLNATELEWKGQKKILISLQFCPEVK